MGIERHQFEILEALVQREDELRAEGREAEWIFMRMPGGRTGFKPDIPNEGSLRITHGDLLDLAAMGYLHELSSTSASVAMKFALTAAGRAAGRPRPVVQEIGPDAPAPGPSPGEDEVLAWLVALERSPGAGAMADGGMLLNQALTDLGAEHLDGVARRILDLRDQGFVVFDDPSASIDQLTDRERLGNGRDFRVTAFGRDRVRDQQRPAGDRHVTQIINAVNAQVAAGNIQNFVTFQAFLDRAEEVIDALDDIDEDAREEAKGLLARLRGATGTVATSAAGGAGGAVLGAVFKQLLGLA
jgi:hypothetical protein